MRAGGDPSHGAARISPAIGGAGAAAGAQLQIAFLGGPSFKQVAADSSSSRARGWPR